jgi:hypothetical protein
LALLLHSKVGPKSLLTLFCVGRRPLQLRHDPFYRRRAGYKKGFPVPGSLKELSMGLVLANLSGI